MTEIDHILDQLERSRRGEAWHGPSLEEALANIDAATAAARPISNAHTIWELALHMASWQDVVRRRLAGEEVVPTPTLDWPEADEASEAAWASALAALRTSRRRLERDVADLSPASLHEAPRPGEVTRYALLHGIIQHDLYHVGQIALLEKAARARA